MVSSVYTYRPSEYIVRENIKWEFADNNNQISWDVWCYRSGLLSTKKEYIGHSHYYTNTNQSNEIENKYCY